MAKTNIDLSEYLKKINDRYNPKNNESLSDILSSFRQISKDFTEFSNSENGEFSYSSYNFNDCTEEEKNAFANTELQFLECLVINTIYDKVGVIWNWFDVYNLLTDEQYKHTDKIKRKVVYSTTNNNRPIGDISYQIWNGMQIIDLDIKNEEICDNLKPVIFNELKKYHWFLGVCKSASGKGLHIWTKITPISIEFKNRKVEYLCNFRHKFSYVYIVLSKYMNKFGYTKENIYSYMDMAMAKPQQGIFISSDDTALLNTNFKDLRLDVNFETAFNTGIESINWISHPDLKTIFSKLEWFNNDTFDKTSNIELSSLGNINERDMSKAYGRKHYKHAQRWQLANTLVSIFGEDKALQLMIEICQGTDKRELRGDIKTAVIHNKPISLWAIGELNKNHGFKINIKTTDIYKDEIDILDKELKEEKDKTVDPTKILNDRTNRIELHINHNQYLSDIKTEILNNLSHISLLEAGAGYGKTEMVKAFGGKTLLILPFTSTIKAKVESSETTKDWLYYYGNKRPTLEELLGNKSMAMTLDKFSRLNVMELDQADFEYIVIDESHLLFTSSYREVMSPCIQRLANCKSKVIMMTGTPTGEMLFFPNIKHIKVIKEDLRIKEFNLYLSNSPIEQFIDIYMNMADDIMEGKKILYVTNDGNLHYEQVTSLIQERLNKLGFNRQLRSFYYKKSNYGDESMDKINVEKTFGSNDIIFGTTYLSVGVDICDKSAFSVYFNKQWIPQDIEQFANRLRNNDLYLKMFLPKKDAAGIPINYYYTQPLDLNFSQKDLILARDMVKTCNDMLERNQEDSKYSPFIQGLLSSSRYLKYDENDCKYYIDETTYKLSVFEERYSEYSKQLQVLLKGVEYYGYKVNINDLNEVIPDENIEFVEEHLKSCRRIRYNEIKQKTFMLLNHINDGNIDMYKELLRGNYEIFKDNSDKNKEIREQNCLYTEDIEILEKNVPIILSLYKYYDCDAIKNIYEYCVDKNQDKINFTKLSRIRKFVNIEYNRRKNKLDFPVIRFIKDCRDWANEHTITNQNEINIFLGNYTAKYANSIKDLVIQDVDFLEKLWDLINEYWKVIIVQARPKNGNIIIRPFELLWETKFDMENIYGNINTKNFFLQELLDDMKEEDLGSYEADENEIPDFEMTNKFKVEDIKDELPNIIHKEYDYNIYSELDKSNERFMRKQENTNQLRDSIFGNMNTVEEVEEKEHDLFENCPF